MEGEVFCRMVGVGVEHARELERGKERREEERERESEGEREWGTERDLALLDKIFAILCRV